MPSEFCLALSRTICHIYPKVNADIKKQMEEQAKKADSMFFPDSFQGISENQNFIITKDALTIYFTPYEIAAYAAGFPQFSIPYTDLKDFIDYNGAFWKSFQSLLQ